MDISELVCKTEYPLLFVHGVGFRDQKHIKYWGRIPKTLESLGAEIYYGGQDAWATIERAAEQLKANLLSLLERTGCGKVNIIAHSRGGLDSRYMISALGCEPYVASLTTISTPHGGSKTMNLLMNFPRAVLRPIGIVADLWFRLLGDSEPNLYAACRQFMTSYADEFNARIIDSPDIYYQSFATAMKSPASDVLEAIPHLVVAQIDGESDGLVSVASAAHGNFRGVLRGASRRGISHVDAVDLRRRGFTRKPAAEGVADIVDVYVEIVKDLKTRGF